MKIIISGGAGFIGGHLIKELLDNGHRVLSLDDFSGGNIQNLGEWVTNINVDCRDTQAINEIFAKYRPDVVYALAANAAEGKSHFSPIDITTRNYNSFLNVLVAGINNGMKKIIVTSSVAVYGSAKPPFSEKTIPHPEDLYGLSKLNMERTLDILSKVHDFEWVAARAHNVYGPGQSMTDPYRNVVMIWMNKILHGEPYIIYGDGSMQRCYTYVSDLVDGLVSMLAPSIKNEIFNLGADLPVSLKELSDIVQEVSGGIVPPKFLPTRVQEVQNATLIHDKAKKLLNYKTTVDLRTGIEETWQWAKKQGPQEPHFTGFEIESSKIPANWRK